jgi:RHS repeat-associated protein
LSAPVHRRSSPSAAGWSRTFIYQAPSRIQPASRYSNQLTATRDGPSAPPLTCGHDANGDMDRVPWLTRAQWDHRNRLWQTARQRVGTGVPETTYHCYDGAGQRVRKATDGAATGGAAARLRSDRVYLWAFELYREFTAAGAVGLARQTVHINDEMGRLALVETRAGSPSSRLVRFQYADHLGSATVELDATGGFISYEAYHPYGSTALLLTRSGTLPKRYRMTGKERDDESGLYYHGARFYAPWLARWTSCDPAGLADGLNRLAYARDNPVNLRDPTGLQTAPAPAPAQPSTLEFLGRAVAAHVRRSNEIGAEKVVGTIMGPINYFEELRTKGPSTIWTREQIEEATNQWLEGIKAPWKKLQAGIETNNPEMIGEAAAEIEFQAADAAGLVAGARDAALSVGPRVPTGVPVRTRRGDTKTAPGTNRGGAAAQDFPLDIKPRPNQALGLPVRTEGEARALAQQHGVDVPDYVDIRFVDGMGKDGGPKAKYGPQGQLTGTIYWDEPKAPGRSLNTYRRGAEEGKVLMTLDRSLLKSDEDLVAHIAHEVPLTFYDAWVNLLKVPTPEQS